MDIYRAVHSIVGPYSAVLPSESAIGFHFFPRRQLPPQLIQLDVIFISIIKYNKVRSLLGIKLCYFAPVETSSSSFVIRKVGLNSVSKDIWAVLILQGDANICA